jgi:ribosome-binding protein aMBF1 (putative translation factor)
LRAFGVRISAQTSPEHAHAPLVPIGTYHVNPFFRYACRVAKSRVETVSSAVVRLLRKEREARGLSMNAVAIKAGLSHTMVSRVERELRKPTLDTLLRMATAMHIDLWPLIRKAEIATGRELP